MYQRRKFKYLALARGEIAKGVIDNMVICASGKVEKVTRLGEKTLYEMSFFKKGARDSFATYWRTINNEIAPEQGAQMVCGG